MNKEVWKDIKGFENKYQISNYGRVKSLSRFVRNNATHKSAGYYTKEKILKPFNNTKGYQLVKLYINNTSYVKKIHRLVAEAFIPNPENKPQVNHIDCNKKNNCVNNLEWTTAKENMEHAWENNLQVKRTGKDNKLSKSVYQYDLNGIFIKKWDSVTEAQNKLKIRNISMVCCGRRNKAGGYLWQY